MKQIKIPLTAPELPELVTKGKWTSDRLFHGVFGYEVTDSNGNTIADCFKNSYYAKRPNGRQIGIANAEHIVKCVNSNPVLISALLKAVEVIKSWHNANEVWDIYFNNAPEMKEIKEAIELIITE